MYAMPTRRCGRQPCRRSRGDENDGGVSSLMTGLRTRLEHVAFVDSALGVDQNYYKFLTNLRSHKHSSIFFAVQLLLLLSDNAAQAQ